MRGIAALSAFLWLCVASVAVADDAAESRFHDERGRRNYEQHHFEQALAEFFEAARLAPSPRITFNIALCFDLLHREDDAYLFFREYTSSDDQDAERRQFAAQALARLGATVSRVQVTSEPPGALIYVDQRDHGAYGEAPRTLAMAPGTHTITLEREGYRPVTLTVEVVRGGEVAAAGTLEQIVGTLHVEASATSEISVRELGGATIATHTTPLDAQLPPGVYEVEVQAEGFHPFRSVTRVGPDARTDLHAELEPLPPPTGDVTITSSAAGALITLDGEAAGFAPTLLEGLSLGTHHVGLAHEGLAPWEGDFTIEENARGWLTVTLEEPPTTDRSPVTWVVGGLGLAALVGGAVFGGLAVANHDQFVATQQRMGMAGGTTPAQLRDQGLLLSGAADTLLAIGATCLVVATILYFVTEHTEARESRATFGAGER